MEGLPPSFAQARQRRETMREALAGLEDAVAAASASASWRTDVRAALRHLRGAFVEHIEEVEGGGGILTDILEDAPRLSNLVELLEKEHDVIEQQLDDLTGTLDAGPVDAIRVQALELMRTMVLHRQRGSDLVYEAYSTDIGGQSG